MYAAARERGRQRLAFLAFVEEEVELAVAPATVQVFHGGAGSIEDEEDAAIAEKGDAVRGFRLCGVSHVRSTGETKADR